MATSTFKTGNTSLTVDISDPITVCEYDENVGPGVCLIHPHLKQLPTGRLIMTTNVDGDMFGAQQIAYASDDEGQTWHPTEDWPATGGTFAALETGECLLIAGGGFFETEQPGVFHLPTRRSADGGKTWGELEPGVLHLDLKTDPPFDMYDPPDWFMQRSIGSQTGEQWMKKWRRPEPTPAEQQLRDQFGGSRIHCHIMQLFPLGGEKLLAFCYLSPTFGQMEHMTICLMSEDAGRTWTHLSTPGPHDDRFAQHGMLSHSVNGLCEPACTRLDNGDLFLVMRLGSMHPLYTTTSSDNGKTWQPQAQQGEGCYYTGWPARPIAVYGILPAIVTLPDGTLALCSGRPDVTLSFSFDDGYHWPWTHRFLEDNKPEEQGTYNNTMVQVSPNRLLLMHDRGGYHSRPPEFTEAKRITAYLIDVTTAR